MTITRQRAKALEDFDAAILRAVAGRFVIVADKEPLCGWCARYSEFSVFADQLKEASALALQLARGQGRPARDGLILLDGGKSK